MSKMYVNGWRSRTNFRILRSSLQVRISRRCSTWATAKRSPSRTYSRLRGRLQSAHAATYREVPDHVKRTEWKTFEENVKYMYKLPLDKCEQHWFVGPLLSESPSIPMPSPSSSSTRQLSQLPLLPQESEQPTTASPSIPSSAPALSHQPTSPSAVFSIPSSVAPLPQQPAASHTVRLQQGKRKTPSFPPPQRKRRN
ncbi:hypothetical protein BDB00DRAFT_812389 [Zychaea mexicana]|uniref:uncharacterized protein n=1 Tax=Zychaea mexicana TaxID=64656 RepID=UPI0022FE9077|nr:uncharacterized protein BDB00DRAFT_812389 [Zychaea mexicana]KAI9495884.1 hypothetical protein BDB00DRAFT_812389 [Zychaea mexicana]